MEKQTCLCKKGVIILNFKKTKKVKDQMDKIKVGIMGFGTIGKRVADAVVLQEDMELVGVVGRSYNWRIKSAQTKGYDIYAVDEGAALKENGIKVVGTVDELLKKVDLYSGSLMVRNQEVASIALEQMAANADLNPQYERMLEEGIKPSSEIQRWLLNEAESVIPRIG